jgi:YVTN family beta-propeller protein
VARSITSTLLARISGTYTLSRAPLTAGLKRPGPASLELYVSNRGSHQVHGPSHGPGSVSVIDFATRAVKVTWFVPGGGSPDMGNVSADGKALWLSGRFDNLVYAIDTSTGEVKTIKVGREPHGLTVWPQPGRYSLGHTGNMR